MSKSWKVWVTALVLVLTAWGTIAAQEVVLRDRTGGRGDNFINAPLASEDGSPLFAPSGSRLRSGGTAGGAGVSAGGFGNLRIGFDYIRPFWSFRDFHLAVPADRAGAFPILGDTGHVDNHFGFAPRIRYDYDLADLIGDEFDFPIDEVGTSIYVLSLNGHLRRQITSAGGGSGLLSANSSLNVVSAIFPEFGKRIPYRDLIDKKNYDPWENLQDLVIELRIGTRFASIDQNYTGSLTSGANTTARFSSQSFRGLGITTAVNFLLPRGEVLDPDRRPDAEGNRTWLWFSNSRASVLVGDNRKESTLNVNVVGQPAVAEIISQSRSVYLPILEQELGVEWRGEAYLNHTTDSKLLVTVRSALTAQFWGDVGPLSAGSTQAYRTSHMFLAGAHIMVGIHR